MNCKTKDKQGFSLEVYIVLVPVEHLPKTGWTESVLYFRVWNICMNEISQRWDSNLNIQFIDIFCFRVLGLGCSTCKIQFT